MSPVREVPPAGVLCYTPALAAKQLSVSRTTIYDLIRRGDLPVVIIAGKYRIRDDHLRAFVDARTQGTRAHITRAQTFTTGAGPAGRAS